VGELLYLREVEEASLYQAISRYYFCVLTTAGIDLDEERWWALSFEFKWNRPGKRSPLS
jgi:hypothetical protein